MNIKAKDLFNNIYFCSEDKEMIKIEAGEVIPIELTARDPEISKGLKSFNEVEVSTELRDLTTLSKKQRAKLEKGLLKLKSTYKVRSNK